MLMGFENALCALLTEPEEVSAFLDALMEYKLKLIDKLAQYYKPDVLTFHDDYGTQLNLFFSPEIFRELFKPQLKKAVDRCHEHGMFFELHSCGQQADSGFCRAGLRLVPGNGHCKHSEDESNYR